MSQLLDQTTPAPLTDNNAKEHDGQLVVPATDATQTPAAPQIVLSFDDRHRAATRWTPVTWMLVLANVGLFAAMAVTHRRLFHFNADMLLTWGGGFAPRVFDRQWWRAASDMFVHGDLTHLSGNLLFLLLIAPLMERLLGSFRFLLVYLFAGIGGGLLAMGTLPQSVGVGASAAVTGVYGALLGCCLRGPRSIPWRVILQRTGILLLYTVVSLLCDWLDAGQQPVAHLGGFVFGLAGGFLCGHKLQPRAARWRILRSAVITTVFAGLIGLTAWWVHKCAAKALTYYERYATAKDRERELLGRFDDNMRQWKNGKITSAQWKRVLEKHLIPALQDMRSSCGLTLTGELAEMEKHNVSMQEFWSHLRETRREAHAYDTNSLSIEEYGTSYSMHCKMRLDTWRDLADELAGDHLLALRAILDDHELEFLDAGMDHEVNEDNPLYRWFELNRHERRLSEKDDDLPDGGLLKNRGFEKGIEGWTPCGPATQIVVDTEVVHEGRQALRLTAPQPADIGCYQDVMLKPGQWYLLSGWVRTRGIESKGAHVWGTLSVCRAEGNTPIGPGKNHKGDTEWTHTHIKFKAPDHGPTRIYVHLSGWGPAVGTAWFDDLKLAEVNELKP
jgi:membrane associated rhomboid family serine protease